MFRMGARVDLLDRRQLIRGHYVKRIQGGQVADLPNHDACKDCKEQHLADGEEPPWEEWCERNVSSVAHAAHCGSMREKQDRLPQDDSVRPQRCINVEDLMGKVKSAFEILILDCREVTNMRRTLTGSPNLPACPLRAFFRACVCHSIVFRVFTPSIV